MHMGALQGLHRYVAGHILEGADNFVCTASKDRERSDWCGRFVQLQCASGRESFHNCEGGIRPDFAAGLTSARCVTF